MKKARTNDLQSWQQRQQPSSSMPSMPSMQQQASHPTFANHPAWYSTQHYGQPDMTRRDQQMDFRYGGPPPPQQPQQQQHHAAQAVQPSMTHPPQPQPQNPQQQPSGPAPAPTPRSRKRPAPGAHPPAHAPQPHPSQHPAQHAPQHGPQHGPQHAPPQPQPQSVQAQTAIVPPPVPQTPAQQAPVPAPAPPQSAGAPAQPVVADDANSTPTAPQAKKSRTNTPWTPQEELRLKQMRDAGNSWAEIAKTFPTRTEGSVKKHWYKDMHYAEFAEDESQALMNAIKEYENNKWKSIGQKVGKPAKACEQYAKEHFPELFATPKGR